MKNNYSIAFKLVGSSVDGLAVVVVVGVSLVCSGSVMIGGSVVASIVAFSAITANTDKWEDKHFTVEILAESVVSIPSLDQLEKESISVLQKLIQFL